MQTTVLWRDTPCSMLGVRRCFAGACCLHHQGDNFNDGYSEHLFYLYVKCLWGCHSETTSSRCTENYISYTESCFNYNPYSTLNSESYNEELNADQKRRWWHTTNSNFKTRFLKHKTNPRSITAYFIIKTAKSLNPLKSLALIKAEGRETVSFTKSTK